MTVGQSVWVVAQGGSPDATLGGYVTVLTTTQNAWTYASTGADVAAGSNANYYGRFPIRRTVAGSNFVATANYVTVTDAGHDLRPGMFVFIATAGASTAFAPGLVEVNKVSANTWTYKTASAAGTASGTMLLAYDYDITLSGGGTLDGNRLNNSSAPAPLGRQGATCIFGNVSNLTIDLAVGSSPVRGMEFNNCTNVMLGKNWRGFDCLVPAQFEGGGGNITVDQAVAGDAQFWDAAAQQADDYVAFTGTKYVAAAQYNNFVSPYGLTGFNGIIDVRSIKPVNTLNGVKLTADASCTFNTVHIGNIVGMLQDNAPSLPVGYAIKAMDDGTNLTGTTIASLIVDGPFVWNTPTGNGGYITLNGSGKIGTFAVRGMIGAAGVQAILAMAGMTVDMLDFGNSTLVPLGTSKPSLSFTGGTVRTLKLRDSAISSDTGQDAIYVSGGVIDNIMLVDNVYGGGATNSTGSVVTLGTNTVKTISIKGARQNGSNANALSDMILFADGVTFDGHGVGSMNVYADDVDLTSSSFITVPGSTATTSVFKVYVGRVKWTATGGGNFLQVGSGAWHLYAGPALEVPAEKLALFAFGAPTYELHVPSAGNCQVNLNNAATYGSAQMAPVNGNELYNSTGGVIAVGRQVRRTAAWSAL